MHKIKFNIQKIIIRCFLTCFFVLLTNAKLVAAEEFKSEQNDYEPYVQNKPQTSTNKLFEFSVSAGMRTDRMSWSEANNTVNIASELAWNNLEIFQIGAAGRLNLNNDLALYGKADFGNINSGTNQDSDYNGNNRTLEYSRSNNKAGGNVQDASLALGKNYNIRDSAEKIMLTITPLLGLSIHQQNLTMTDGFQVIPYAGNYPGLNSTYNTEWQGPWAGIDTQWKLGEKWSLIASIEYHWADFAAQANWNLRQEYMHPVSFTHMAKGYGVFYSAGASCLASNGWHLNISAELRKWHGESGTDRTYYSDGSMGTYPLNEVNWEATIFNFALTHDF